MDNVWEVLSGLWGNVVGEGGGVIGVGEVENDRVVRDVVSEGGMGKYKFVDYEGGERGGIECGVLYDGEEFGVRKCKVVVWGGFEGDRVDVRGGLVIVEGRMGGEGVCLIVNEWGWGGGK